jgi:hypothetical protein
VGKVSNTPSLEQMLKLYSKKDLWNRIQEKQATIQTLNARVHDLEHRLSNCIEPKFKIGQEVWVVFSSIQRFPFKCQISDFRYVYSKRKFYYSGTGENGDYDFAEQIWCETEEEAKAKLRSLQDEN